MTTQTMSELEMVKACAEAMELSVHEVRIDTDYDGDFKSYLMIDGTDEFYWPLDDDAQAMALARRFRLNIDGGYDNGALLDSEKTWTVEHNDGEQATVAVSHDLNHAIVECVARMHKETK